MRHDLYRPKLAENEGLRQGVRAYASDPDNAKAPWAEGKEMVRATF